MEPGYTNEDPKLALDYPNKVDRIKIVKRAKVQVDVSKLTNVSTSFKTPSREST